MSISEYRSSFLVYIVDTSAVDLRGVQEILVGAGYRVNYFVTAEDLQASIQKDPPHIMFCAGKDEILFGGPFSLWFKEIKEVLPELQLFLASSPEDSSEFSKYLAQGLYDIVSIPVLDDEQLLRAADRAAECNYYLYMNEQLRDKAESRGAVSASSLSLLEMWMDQMMRSKTYSAAIDHYMNEVFRYLKGSAIIYFKYISGYHSLVVSQSVGHDLKNLSGVGLQLSEDEPNFEEEDLRWPEKLKSLNRLMKEGFLQENYSAYPLFSGHHVVGVFTIFSKESEPLPEDLLHDPYIKVCLKALSSVCFQLDLEKKLHQLSSFDDKTHVLNRQHLLKRLNEEVSRARRTNLPVSFLIISIDGFRDLTLAKDKKTGDKILKNVAGVIESNSRINDIIGRLGSDEFGIVLPHTGKKGGSIKAERLRRIIDTVDFSKVIKDRRNISVSIGISEYPSLCQDSDDLVQSADEALYQIKKTGKNKVCLAKAPENFTPDFETKDY